MRLAGSVQHRPSPIDAPSTVDVVGVPMALIEYDRILKQTALGWAIKACGWPVSITLLLAGVLYSVLGGPVFLSRLHRTSWWPS
jgi:hypothetical protein